MLAEMFKLLENQFDPHPDFSYHVFKGKHCFPLSPSDKNKFDADGLP